MTHGARASRLSYSDLFIPLLLGFSVAVAHGWSLADGTVLDDWWHQKALRENGWSFSELMRSLEIEPAKFIEAWWQNEPVRWEYGRPLFILAMKVVYVLLGGADPFALHLFSLALHFASALLIWRIALRLGARPLWSFFSALLFVVYPHALVTVAWPSSQNVVIQTTLVLAALLIYLRATGLNVAAPAENAATRSPAHSTTVSFVLVVLLWSAALLTRENALMLPVILLALEWANGGWRSAWARRHVFVAFALIGVAFILWRALNVTTPMPDVYVRRPDGDALEYSLWLVAKVMHYLCASLWLAPMTVGPTGRLNPFVEAPLDCALMAAILALMLGGYWLAARHAQTRWIWPLWMLLAILPVAPIIATPHSGYMSGVAFALGGALAMTSGRALWQRAFGRAAVIIFVVAMSVMTLLNRWQWTAIIAAERYLPAWVMSSPPSRQATDVFFINMPFVNVYVKPNLTAQLGPWFERVTCHVLTYSPDPVLFEQRCWLTQVDEHTLRLRIEGQPYFSRLLGRFLIEGFRDDKWLPQVVRGPACEARILQLDRDGVRELLFTFPKPLSDPSYCFYLTTKDCGAVRLRFPLLREPDLLSPHPERLAAPAPTDIRAAVALLRNGAAEAADVLFEALQADPRAAEAAGLRPVALAVATALAAETQDVLAQPELSASDWGRVRAWWRQAVTSDVLTEIWVNHPKFSRYVEEREEAPHARMWAAKVIRSDLYLTGPPFAGPWERD